MVYESLFYLTVSVGSEQRALKSDRIVVCRRGFRSCSVFGRFRSKRTIIGPVFRLRGRGKDPGSNAAGPMIYTITAINRARGWSVLRNPRVNAARPGASRARWGIRARTGPFSIGKRAPAINLPTNNRCVLTRPNYRRAGSVLRN